MDELHMDFEGGIDTLDLSSVGNAEEVGASTLLQPMKSICDGHLSTLPCGLRGSQSRRNTDRNGSQDLPPLQKSNRTLDNQHTRARKSPENMDISVDFDVDSFLNNARKNQDCVDKVSTVIHYVPATEINCSMASNGDERHTTGTCSSSCDEAELADSECEQRSHLENSLLTSTEVCTKVVSVNSSPLNKQNLMAKNLLGLCSIVTDTSPDKRISSRILPEREDVLGISCNQAGDLKGQRIGSDPSDDLESVREISQASNISARTNGEEVEKSISKVQKELCAQDINTSKLTDSDSDKRSRKTRSSGHNDNTKTSEQEITQFVEYNIHIDDTQKIKDEDGKTKWSCNLCGGTYSSKHNLVTHILAHSNIRPHYCLQCGKMFRQLSHLQTHLLTHANTRPHACHIGKRGFTQLSHLKRHMITHQDVWPIACKFCGRGFAYTSELKAHEAKHEKAKQKSCDECGTSFDTNRKLKHHITTVHSKSKDLVCTECNKVFNYPSQLRDHMLKHTGKRAFGCDKCDMKFMKEHHLRAHQITHTDVKPYSCPTCSRSFNQHGNLQRHMLIHAQEKQFRCNVCSKAFAQQQVLQTHMLTHSSEKPHKCPVCEKGFTRAHNLKAHMSMHKDKKPHVCLCGASFTVKGNLNRHRKQYHGQCGKISMEEEAAFILKSMSTKTSKSEQSQTNAGPKIDTKVNPNSVLTLLT